MEKEEKSDVDALYAELAEALKAPEGSSEEEPSGSSTQKPKAEDKPAEIKEPEDDGKELSEEEISKLGPKAQKRIRELASRVKELAEKPAEKSPAELPDDPKPEDAKFKSVDEFLNAVADKPSRILLQKFYEVMRSETSEVLAPIERQNREAKFNAEFSQFETIDGLSDHKSDIMKTFMRTPGASVKSLVGETMTELALAKVKPSETGPSLPNRGRIDTSNLSKDQLYDALDAMRSEI